MISVFLSACVLSFLTVTLHATGIAVLVRGLIRHHPPTTSAWLITRMLLRMIWWLVLLHLAEIAIGAASICGADACPMPKLRSTFPGPPTPPWVTAM